MGECLRFGIKENGVNALTGVLGGDSRQGVGRVLSPPDSPIALGRMGLSKEVEVILSDPSNKHWFPYLSQRICQCQSEQAKI